MSGDAEVPADQLRISVVVPSWRDADSLAVLLPKLAGMGGVAETIVVDASGDERSAEIARKCGAQILKCSAPNRGAQMNVGATFASGDGILFQHADTDLTAEQVEAIRQALRDPEIIGGAFHRRFDDRHPRLVWLERAGRYLTEHGGTLYGDQSIFVRREVFLRMQGFAQIPLMEDVEFSKRLRAAGKLAILDPPVSTSARRHLREGAWKATIQNGLFILLYKLGVSPTTLHRWYYSTQQISAASSNAARTTPSLALRANQAHGHAEAGEARRRTSPTRER